jgi:hypothetical protein
MPGEDRLQVSAETAVSRSAEVGNSASAIQREIERCRREIQAIEDLLRGGHPDVAGLCLALSDWSAELRILEGRAWKNESSNF